MVKLDYDPCSVTLQCVVTTAVGSDITLIAANGITDEQGLITAAMLGAHRVVLGIRFFGVIKSDNTKGHQREILRLMAVD